MRKYQHLHTLIQHHNGIADKTELASLLMHDLESSICQIYAETLDEEPVLLAELKTQPETLTFYKGILNPRIEWIVTGEIIEDQYPAIKYQVNGAIMRFYGRCSTIPQVCGVDLYLDKSYTGNLGDRVKQPLTIPVGKLYRSIT